ncbi:transcriptional antiterminator BglG [Brachyspira hampsonii]|uniref:Transcriptional antiterminator BglG n=1 Tax=Brachyspira hampsonii TaxID=1287055 RepID=A0A1E5NFQ3_9SPIR|nr:HTH domain-containing protein [Brachyspira hampsonii]OEJ14992.1 transcriptional antiterminator BglG [Brachyspira hampsonii]
MSFTKVYLDILKEINNNPISINTLVEKYTITSRAIRYYIDNINNHLKKYRMPEIYIKSGKIYFNLDYDALISFIEKIPINEYLLSQDERKKYILFNFLFKENITISKLEKNIGVSRTTIKNDINDLKEYINNFELYFYLENNKIRLGGNEKKLRHLKFLNMIKYINLESNKINYINSVYPNEKMELLILKEYVNQADINIIYKIIIEVEKKLKSKFSDKFKNIMSIYLIATLERINNNHIIKKKNNAAFLIKLPEYKKIKIVLNNFLFQHNNKNYKYEMLHLTEYFLSEYYNEHFYENKIISEKFILKILEDMNIEIEDELVEEISKYLLPAIYRIKNNFCIDKNLDFCNIDANVFNMVKNSVENNMSYLYEPLREEEIYYIAKIIENYTCKYDKISLKELIKTIYKNNNDKKLLIEKIKRKFSKFIYDDIVDSSDYNILNFLKKQNIYIIKDNIYIDNILNSFFNYKYINKKNITILNNTVKEFGQYFFIKEKIFLFSNMYSSINNIDDKPCIHLIVSKKSVIVNDKEANILFFIIVNNKTEHLQIVSQIMKLSEDNNFMKEIINQETPEKIILSIRKYYSHTKKFKKK